MEDSNQIQTMVVVSYMPLIYPDDVGKRFWDSNEPDFMQSIKSTLAIGEQVSTSAEAVVWTTGYEPVFVIDKAKEIRDHINAWSEGEPNNWFTLQWMVKNSQFALVLMPNIQKSIERQKNTYKTLTGSELPKNCSYQVLFKPINFISNRPNIIFSEDKCDISDKVNVGFIDSIFHLKNMEKPHFLASKIKVEHSKNDYINSLFEDSKNIR